MSELKDNSVRYLWTIRFLYGVLIFHFIFLLNSIFIVAANTRLLSDSDIRFYNEFIYRKVFYLSILHYLFYILWHLFFVMWLYRAYSTIHKRSNEILFAKSWIVVAWFVPLVHLFLPFRVMKNLFSVTHSIVNSDSTEQAGKSKRILLDWQMLFVFTWVFTILMYTLPLMNIHFENTKYNIIILFLQVMYVLFVLSKMRLIRYYRALELKLNVNAIDQIPNHGEDLLDQ